MQAPSTTPNLIRTYRKAIKAHLKSTVRGTRSHYRNCIASNRIAKRALDSIEAELGKTDPNLIKLADEYAEDHFKNLTFSPWLRVYTAWNQEFKEGWIPDNFFGMKVVPKLKGDYGDISMQGALARSLFQSGRFPDILYYVNGIFSDVEGNIIPRQEVKSLLFSNSDKVVYKLDGSYAGRGVQVITKEDFEINEIESNGVFQQWVNQHDFYGQFGSQGVATLRLVTMLEDDGTYSLRGGFFKFPNPNEMFVTSPTSFKFPIDYQTGVIGKVGVSRWRPIYGCCATGQALPDYDRCVDMVFTHHKRYPFARKISWDLVLDRCGEIAILEWNGHYDDLKTSEMLSGPLYADLNWERYV